MKRAILTAVAICISISLLTGCASMIAASTGNPSAVATGSLIDGVVIAAGGFGLSYWMYPKKPKEEHFPQPSVGFQPKRNYDVTYEKM